MDSFVRSPATGFNRVSRLWKITACVAWAMALPILSIRSAGGYHRTIAFINFQLAGLHWTRGEDLYADWRGFVYSPLVAAFFTPFAFLPSVCGIVLWQLLIAAALLGGLAELLQMIFPTVRTSDVIVFMLIIPFET